MCKEEKKEKQILKSKESPFQIFHKKKKNTPINLPPIQLKGSMCLQHHNAKGFISAWHNHRITGFEERLVQGSTHGQLSDMTLRLQIRESQFLTENVNFHHFLPKRSFTHETLIFFSQLPQQPLPGANHLQVCRTALNLRITATKTS